MSIGTTLFHALNTQALSRQGKGIADLQEQISSGKNDPRPSADPLRALRLSAANEQTQALGRFSSNLERAITRLDQADSVMDASTNILQRFTELALRATSDSVAPAERATIAIEARELRSNLLDMANARDDTGRPLFGGYLSQGNPFQETPDGIVYRGDGGQNQLQVSESSSLPTTLSGIQAFLSVPGAPKGDVFALLDDFIAVLGGGAEQWRDQAVGQDSLQLGLQLGRAPSAWQMQIEGPNGVATIRFDAALGAEGAGLDAINAASAQTGVSAQLNPANGQIMLQAQGRIAISNVAATPAPDGPLIFAQEGQATPQAVVSPGQTPGAQIGRLRVAADHFADLRAQIGAMAASATTQAEVISTRQVVMEKALSGLQDLDLASAITRLQQSLLARDATQQAYVKITQKSLFDYIR